MRTHRPATRAFSLVELVLMLAIIGVLGAIAGPRYANSLALYRAQAAAQRVIADLNLARWQAKANSLGQSVVFDPAANGYTLPGVAGLSGKPSPYAVQFAAEPYMAKLAAVDFASSATLTFDRYGQPSAGGTITVQSGNASRTITLDAVTGEAAVQ